MDNRRKIRQAALCLVFENQFVDDPEGTALKCFGDVLGELDEREYEQAVELSRGVVGSSEELDDIIGRFARDWKVSRMSTTDLCILRTALYEIIHLERPYKVCINEAVELAKLYSDARSPAFVNGVLGGYVNRTQ